MSNKTKIVSNDTIARQWLKAFQEEDQKAAKDFANNISALADAAKLNPGRISQIISKIHGQGADRMLFIIDGIGAGIEWDDEIEDEKFSASCELFVIPVTGVMEDAYEYVQNKDYLYYLADTAKDIGILGGKDRALIWPQLFRPQDLNKLMPNTTREIASMAKELIYDVSSDPMGGGALGEYMSSKHGWTDHFTPYADGNKTIGARFLLGARMASYDADSEPDMFQVMKTGAGLGHKTVKWHEATAAFIEGGELGMEFQVHAPVPFAFGRAEVSYAMVFQFASLAAMQIEGYEEALSSDFESVRPQLLLSGSESGLVIKAVSKTGDLLSTMIMDRSVMAHAGKMTIGKLVRTMGAQVEAEPGATPPPGRVM